MAGLSKPYDSVEDAMMGGFKWVLNKGVDWHTNEYGFWVISQLSADRKKANYHYCEPKSSGGDHVEMTLPAGVPVFANCHTHPKNTNTRDFSPGDERQFEKVSKARAGVAWYLMNRTGEIRRAITAGEFPAGVTVKWNDKITP